MPSVRRASSLRAADTSRTSNSRRSSSRSSRVPARHRITPPRGHLTPVRDDEHPHIATLEYDGRRFNVTCRISFDGIEYVGHLWFADEAWDDNGVPDRGSLPGPHARRGARPRAALTPQELMLRYRRALAEKRRFTGLRKATEDILEKIRYLNQVAISMRAGLLDSKVPPPRSSSPSGSSTRSSRSSRSSPASRDSARAGAAPIFRHGSPHCRARPRADRGAPSSCAARAPSRSRAYEQAASALLALDTDDLAPLLRSGEPRPPARPRARHAVGRARSDRDGRVLVPRAAARHDAARPARAAARPGLGTAKIHKLHEALGVDSIESLEQAARDGRVAKLPRYGTKTAEKLLEGSSACARRARSASIRRAPRRGAAARHGARPSRRARRREWPARCAGGARRWATWTSSPRASRPEARGHVVRQRAGRPSARGDGGSVAITYVDGTCIDLHCVAPEEFAIALWRATGPRSTSMPMAPPRRARLHARRRPVARRRHAVVPWPTKRRSTSALGSPFVPPELREGRGEIEAAAAGRLPTLLEAGDIRGVLHCHSTWSDGKATIAQMADAARERGWSYIGITDHSQAAFYAGGLTRERVLAQHDEIDALNATRSDVRVLKGVEADILADGAIDYDDDCSTGSTT